MTTDAFKEQFERDVADFVEWIMEEKPTWASDLGKHDYDCRLDDVGIATLELQNRRISEYKERFKQALGSSDLDTQIDAALMISLTKAFMRNFEELRMFARAPQYYVGMVLGSCHSLITRDYAPLPDRLKALLGRMSEVPRVLEQGMHNLENPPKVWLDLSIAMAKGGISLFENDIPQVAQEVPDLLMDVRDSSKKAADAMRSFLAFLEDDVRLRADGEFAVGEEIFNELLHSVHMLDADARSIQKKGYEILKETEQQFDELVARLGFQGKNRNDIVFEIAKKHPKAEELIDTYKKAMMGSRQFILDRNLVTLPPWESLEMRETPKFERHLLPFAAYGPPGPFEEKQIGIFWVNPVDPELPPDVQEMRLRSHPYAKIPIHAVHEGYPGHHVQLVWANKVGSLARKIGCISSLHVEGWAFYTEEMMERQGFLSDPEVRIFRLKEQLWRACRIVIDVGIQTGEMSLEEAAQMLVDRAGFEQNDAIAEVTRYTLAPTQPMSYLIGKLELMKTAEEYKMRRGSSFDLKTFHDAVLACGSLTPSLIRRRLFEGEELRLPV